MTVTEAKTEKEFISNTIKEILEHYTKEQQVMQSIEEMSELQKELIKNINRNAHNKESIMEEIADVKIMLMQLQKIYDFKNSEIRKVIISKLERQKKRMED